MASTCPGDVTAIVLCFDLRQHGVVEAVSDGVVEAAARTWRLNDDITVVTVRRSVA